MVLMLEYEQSCGEVEQKERRSSFSVTDRSLKKCNI